METENIKEINEIQVFLLKNTLKLIDELETFHNLDKAYLRSNTVLADIQNALQRMDFKLCQNVPKGYLQRIGAEYREWYREHVSRNGSYFSIISVAAFLWEAMWSQGKGPLRECLEDTEHSFEALNRLVKIAEHEAGKYPERLQEGQEKRDACLKGLANLKLDHTVKYPVEKKEEGTTIKKFLRKFFG